MRSQVSCLILLFLINSFCVAAQKSSHDVSAVGKRLGMSKTQVNACIEKWAEWKRKYSGASPYGAHRKMNKLISSEAAELDSVIKGTKLIKYQFQDGKKTYDIEKRAASNGRFFASINKDGRNDMNTAYLAHLVRNNPPKTLLIVSTGSRHVRDYYFEDPHKKVNYTTKKVDENSKYFTSEMYTFINALSTDLHAAFPEQEALVDNILTEYMLTFGSAFKIRGSAKNKLTPISASSSAVDLHIDLLAALYQDQKRGVNHLKSADLLATPKDANVIIVGDNHLLDDLTPIENLPSSLCLKVVGYENVRFVYEGIPHSKTGYTPRSAFSLLNYSNRLKKNGVNLGGNQMSLFDLVKAVSPTAFKILETQRVQLTPADLYSLRKADQLRKGGLNVKVQGLEFSSRTDAKFKALLLEWTKRRKRWNNHRKYAMISGSTSMIQGITRLWNETEEIEKKLLNLESYR